MLLRTKFKRLQRQVNTIEQGASGDIIYLDKELGRLSRDYARLKRHISSNGLWGTVRALVKRVDELHAYQQNLARVLEGLNTNGVATAINKLNAEVFGQSKESGSTIERVMLAMNGVEPRQDPTLAAKVDAIIAHLGLDVTVEPEKVTRTPAKIVAKKVKAPKKGRR